MRALWAAVAASTLAVAPVGALSLAESTALRTGGPCHEAVDAIMPAPVRASFHYIVNRESGGREWATHVNTNGTIDRGCSMINSVWTTGRTDPSTTAACLLTAPCNIGFARKLYATQGMSPWR